jgi:hypothetical protein
VNAVKMDQSDQFARSFGISRRLLRADLQNIREVESADLIVGQTVGAGHFNNRVVPEQVNAMIERFLATTVKAHRANSA